MYYLVVARLERPPKDEARKRKLNREAEEIILAADEREERARVDDNTTKERDVQKNF
jgi:hypothetical protein